jgi:hypothetical protein
VPGDPHEPVYHCRHLDRLGLNLEVGQWAVVAHFLVRSNCLYPVMRGFFQRGDGEAGARHQHDLVYIKRRVLRVHLIYPADSGLSFVLSHLDGDPHRVATYNALDQYVNLTRLTGDPARQRDGLTYSRIGVKVLLNVEDNPLVVIGPRRHTHTVVAAGSMMRHRTHRR